MSIIARRIPSGLGYLPSTTVRAHTVRGGLGVEEALGFFMLPAYSTTPTTTSTAPATATVGCTGGYIKNVYGYCAPPPTPAKSTDWGSIASSLSSFLTPKAATPAAPAAAMPAYMPAASGGMSKGTMIAIGVGAVGLLAVVMLTRK
jgi:hypothetical protein